MSETTNVEGLLAAIKEGAAHGLVVYDTLLVLPIEKGGQIAYPWAEWEGDPTAFLDIAARVGARIVYAVGTRFDWEGSLRQEVEAAGYRYIPEVGEKEPIGGSPTDPASWLLYRLRERTEEWARHDGEMSMLQCIWMKDGVAHDFRPHADWLAAFRATIDEALEDAEAVQDEDRRLRSTEDAKRLHGRAGEMARHARYPEATSEAKREYMAQQLFPDEDPIECQRIARRSVVIYWWEVEPAERASNAQRARELYDAGETLTTIAALFKMSRDKVKALLAEADEG